MLTKVIDTHGFNAVVKGRYGFMVYNKNDTYVGRAIAAYGEYSELEADLFLRVCGPSDIVVEVGANMGAHTIALSTSVGVTGRVYAFEPQRIMFQALCGTVALNSIANVECYQYAVSSGPDTVKLPDFDYGSEGNFGALEIGRYHQGVNVPVVCLDDFLDIGRLKLLKIDVEGMELQVLEGARKTIARLQPVIYLENDRPEKSAALIDMLMSMGYRMFWHMPPLYNPRNFAGNQENIYGETVSVNMACFPARAQLNIAGLQEVADSTYHPLK